MSKKILLPALLALMPAVLFAAGQGDFCIHVTNQFGATDTVAIGEVNTVEIWVANDATLSSLFSALEFQFPEAISWIMDGALPEVGLHNRVVGNHSDGSVWDYTGQILEGEFDGASPDTILLLGVGFSPVFPAGPSELTYTFEFEVPAGQADVPQGFTIALAPKPPTNKSLEYGDAGGAYFPDFCGAPGPESYSTPMHFDIVDIPWLHGDCNRDGLVNITDVVYTVQYIFVQGPDPKPFLAGDSNCDGIVNITDAVFTLLYVNGGPSGDCW